jgi:predicted  nucleic acid-binding Zn-ribbon protein
MHQDLATAIDLQTVDLRIAELRGEISTLPKQIAEIERKLEGGLRRLELDKTALAANLRDRKRLEAEAQAQREKISKLHDQMLGAKTNEQYRAFQKEIEFCEQSIRKAEDQVIERMLEAETLEKNVKIAEVALAAEKKRVDGEKTIATARTSEAQAALKIAQAERAKLAARLPAPLLAIYDRLRTRYYKDGDVIAEARDSKCMSCMMLLRPQFFQDVKNSKEVMFCENCRRILFYEEPPTDLQGQME